MKKTVVVVNPRSQGGALARKWPAIERTLRHELPEFDAVMTESPGDATRKTRAALAAGAERVVAVGGDGTIHEVANGFFEGGKPVKPGAELAVLPFGTGGDFRKTPPIPRDVADAARIIRAGHTRTIDLGRLEYIDHAGQPASCIFINIASFGIGGLVDDYVNRSSKMLGGKVSFFMAALRAGMSYKNQRVRLQLHDQDREETTIYNVAVANGRYFGGGMFIAPHAELDDAKFDVVTLGDLSFMDTLKDTRAIYKGTHLASPKVTSRRAAKVLAEPLDDGARVLLDIDGEALGRLPATFTVLPHALELVVP